MISVTLVSVKVTKDDLGDETSETTRQRYDRVRFAPRSSSERTDSRSPAVITGASLYRRGDFPAGHEDRIEIRGVDPMIDGDWQVDGDPGFWGRGVEVAVKRVG